ncbi:MAG: hypothetical protein ACO22H_04645, partial [Bacilli bacterium]
MIRHKVMTLFSFAAMILPMFFIAAKPSVSSLNGETSSQKTAPLEITKSTKTIPQGIVNHQWRETLLPSQASLTGEVVRTPISYDYATWSNTDIQQVIRLDSQPAYVEYQVNVPQAYEIVMTMDYLPLDLGIRDIEIAVMVNGEYPFADAEQITLKKWWITPHSFATDRYENEIMPKATLDQSWRAQPLMDSQRLQANPLLWSLQP